MSDQHPSGDEPTRAAGSGSAPQPGGPPPQQPNPYGQPPPQQPNPYGQQQWGPPGPGQPGQGQPGQQGQQWGPPGQGQPGSGQPGQPPWGSPGQQQWGAPDQTQQMPGWGQGGYGAPPPGYGGGPGGPGGDGSGRRKGLIIAGAVAAVVLVVGGVGVAVALTAGDDDDGEATASEATSASAEPTEEASDEATDEATDEASAEATEEPTEAEPVEPSGESYTAEALSDVGEVCKGQAMTNAAAYDPARPTVIGMMNYREREEYFSLEASSGYDRPWKVEYDKFEKVQVVGCLAVVAGSEKKTMECKTTDVDDKRITINWHSQDYTLTFVEAATGEEISSGPTVTAPASECPSFVTYNPETFDAYDDAEAETVDAAIEEFIAAS